MKNNFYLWFVLCLASPCLASLPVSANDQLISSLAEMQELVMVRLSPSGEKVATLRQNKKRRILNVYRTKDFKNLGNFELTRKTSRMVLQPDFGSFDWVNENMVVSQAVTAKGGKRGYSFFGGLVSFDIESKQSSMGVLSDIDSRFREGGAWARVISYITDKPDTILISLERHDKDFDNIRTIHSVNTITGESHYIADYPELDAKVYLDESYRLALAIGKSNKYLFSHIDNQWKPVKGLPSIAKLISVNRKEGSIHFLSTLDNGQRALFEYKKNCECSKPIYSQAPGVSEVYVAQDGVPVAALVESDFPVVDPIKTGLSEDKDYANDLAFLVKNTGGQRVSIVDTSVDGRKWLVLLSSDTDNGTVYFFDRSKKKLALVGSFGPNLPQDMQVNTYPFTFTSLNRNSSIGYLSIPINTETSNLPAVVIIDSHYPTWRFDHITQLLGNHGVSTIRIRPEQRILESSTELFNYEYVDKPAHILQGLNYLISQGLINKDKLCVMSEYEYAFQLAELTATSGQLFKCGILVNPVSDLVMYRDNPKIRSRWLANLSNELLSSRNLVKQLTQKKMPLLIGYSAKPQYLSTAQAENLLNGLEEADMPITDVRFINTTETLRDEANQSLLFQSVLTFIKKHL